MEYLYSLTEKFHTLVYLRGKFYGYQMWVSNDARRRLKILKKIGRFAYFY